MNGSRWRTPTPRTSTPRTAACSSASARSIGDENEFVCIEGFRDADAGAAHVKNDYVKKFFEVAPDLVATQPQIIYIDTPHDGFGPMGEIKPR